MFLTNRQQNNTAYPGVNAKESKVITGQGELRDLM